MPVKQARTSGGDSPPKKNAQVTGTVGQYYARYQLSLLGWNTMPTARNARGIDIVAYSSIGQRILGIQVKALSARNAVPLGNSLNGVMGNFWLIVTRALTEPCTYVLPPDEVRAHSHPSGEDGHVSYWLEATRYENAAFREAWHRIGRGDA